MVFVVVVVHRATSFSISAFNENSTGKRNGDVRQEKTKLKINEWYGLTHAQTA